MREAGWFRIGDDWFKAISVYVVDTDGKGHHISHYLPGFHAAMSGLLDVEAHSDRWNARFNGLSKAAQNLLFWLSYDRADGAYEDHRRWTKALWYDSGEQAERVAEELRDKWIGATVFRHVATR